jgi:hypothetical protein
MSKRTVLTTHDYLINAALPAATETYTVIPHADVINHTKAMFAKKNFEVVRELYRCNQEARVAQGVYHLNYGNDPDVGLLFAWSNSYDKSMKFKCSIGAYVHESLASIIPGNMGTWGRKHTGTADNESFDTITSQIMDAEKYFAELLQDKERMKTMVVSDRIRAELMGRLYFIQDVFTTEQLSLIKQQFAKPSYNYSGMKDSLWSMYNAIIYSLQKAHPRTWMDQQRMVHWFLCKEFNLGMYQSPAVIEDTQNSLETVIEDQVEVNQVLPKQYDLEEMIAEVEQEQAMEAPEPMTEEPKEAVPDTTNDLPWIDSDDTWICLSCNQEQNSNSVFFDGQICGTCKVKQDEENKVPSL